MQQTAQEQSEIFFLWYWLEHSRVLSQLPVANKLPYMGWLLAVVPQSYMTDFNKKMNYVACSGHPTYIFKVESAPRCLTGGREGVMQGQVALPAASSVWPSHLPLHLYYSKMEHLQMLGDGTRQHRGHGSGAGGRICGPDLEQRISQVCHCGMDYINHMTSP